VDKDGVIIEGHTRRLAAMQLGMKEVPVVYATDLAPDEVAALRVIDNKTAELAEWNMDMLAEEMLKLTEFDMGDFGFDVKSLTDMGVEDLGTSDDDFDYDETPDGRPDVEAITRAGDVWRLGEHRLMCGDSTSEADVARLMAGVEGGADCLLTDPPYNVNYGARGKQYEDAAKAGKDYQCGHDSRTILNDNMGDAAFARFLEAVFRAAAGAMRPGAAFYVFHASSTARAFENAMNAAGLEVRQQLIWAKEGGFTLGRQDYQWSHEPCQPAGTMVAVPGGEVPIERLRDGDRVVSFDTYSGALKGLRDGVPVRTTSRQYDGLIYSVSAGGRTTRATDNHEFSVRFRPDAKRNYCTYLMRRGKWWRVGHTRAYDARQFGLKSRFHQEKAEEAWLIECFATRADAQVAEQRLAVEFGIPYTHWEVGRGFAQKNPCARTWSQIRAIYEGLDLDKMRQNAYRLLHEHGRSERFPLIAPGRTSRKLSTRVTCRIEACNLIPELMQVPVPRGGYGCADGRLFDWTSIDCVSFSEFSGRVYSLAVEPWKHYIADGIVTHNCFYGWKEGAAHTWNLDRRQTTVVDLMPNALMKRKDGSVLLKIGGRQYALRPDAVVEEMHGTTIWVPKPVKCDLHPTMKPIALCKYLMENSTGKGDVVLDLFGGSGSTMMAAERSGRRCRSMELDPKYATVAIQRWEAETGGKAEKIEEAGKKE
jgi:DNA modification methylase